ncbi:MAG: 3-isopropylmalate dehydratase small subunit [Pseudomonadota bacterium]
MLEPFLTHEGTAAVLMRDNVDTDQIIPSREMKTVSQQGLGEGLFAAERYLDPAARRVDPDFVLNRPEQVGSTILISGENFGCGSSREHAVWALKEYGIRAVIAKSFGEIFHGNCIRNGVLPVTLAPAQVDQLAAIEAPVRISINLEDQILYCSALPDWSQRFEIGEFARRLLTEGLDPITLTLTEMDRIEAFQARDAEARPWVYAND